MSHMIEIVDGKAQMAYAGETPWHGLGTEVSNDLTPRQMMEKAGVDWEVIELPSFVETEDGTKIKTGQKSLLRKTDNRLLTNVGMGWKPVQNEVAFDFFTEFVLAGDMEMHTAGSLKDGQYVWALAKVKESFEVFKGDQVDSFLLFSNPHVYGKPVDVRFTPIRVVCNNTLTMSLGQKVANSIRVGHRTQFDPDAVKTALGLAQNKFAKYKEMAEFLGSKKVTADLLISYFDQVFPKTSGKDKDVPAQKVDDLSRAAKMCYDALEVQPGAEFAKGTFWPAFNSVTYFTDHVQGHNADNRLYNQWFGNTARTKLKAAELAVDMAKAV